MMMTQHQPSQQQNGFMVKRSEMNEQKKNRTTKPNIELN
jgi:hypothetical protein